MFLFSTQQLIFEMLRPRKNSKDSQSCFRHSMASHKCVVSTNAESAGSSTLVPSQKHSKKDVSTFSNRRETTMTPPGKTHKISFSRFIWKLMMKNGMSGKVADYCSDHWHKATLVNYGYKLNHWLDFNKHINQGPLEISHQKFMDFLIYLFEERHKTVCTVKNTYPVMRILCHAGGCPITPVVHQQISMLLKGMFIKKPDPVHVKSDSIWDIGLLLDYFAGGRPNSHLTLKDLGGKLACLILLVSMRRKVDLAQLDTGSLKWSADKRTCRFLLKKPTKTYSIYTKKSHAHNLQVLTLTSLPLDNENPMDKELCPVRCLKFYLKRTNALRLRHINTRLFICTCEPFGPATLQTISRWVKEIMLKAGINMENVNKVNFRSASASRAYSMGVSLTTIMNRAGWSRGSTFTRHYLKNIERRDPTTSSNKQIVDHVLRGTRNPVLTGAQGGRGLDGGRKIKKFAQLWS